VRRGDPARSRKPGAAPGAGSAHASGAVAPTALPGARLRPVVGEKLNAAAGEGAKNPLAGPNAAGPNAVGPNAAGAHSPSERLSYLHVTFERDLKGNINRREITFADQCRATFGPVDDWQGKIDPDDFASFAPGSVVMKCDQLTVRETPAARTTDRGAMEMEAVGGTVVEGQMEPQQGAFTAHSHRLTYAEAKDLLVLEGDGRSDAELYRQLKPGTPATKLTARKIMYWQQSNRAEVDDARYIDLNLPGGGNIPAFKDPLMKKK
jgi:hypothetical protein